MAGRLGVGATNTVGAMALITNTTASDTALVVKGAVSQTGALISLQNSAGTSVFNVQPLGNMEIATNIGAVSAFLEIGKGRTANGATYIDFVGDTVWTDYGLRIIRNSGENGQGSIQNRGTGGLSLSATEIAPITFSTQNIERVRVDSVGNLLVGMTATATSSTKTLHLGNATVPTANPTGGGVLYVESGALKYRGSSGTVTTLGNA